MLTNADLVAIDASGNNRLAIVDDNGIHGGPINWGMDDNIYFHSIYLGATNFIINSYYALTLTKHTLLSSNNHGFISRILLTLQLLGQMILKI